MTLVSIVKATESYQVSLITINRQTSYDSCNLSQNYGIIRGLSIGFTILVVHLPEWTEKGLIAAWDQTVQEMCICNSWF